MPLRQCSFLVSKHQNKFNNYLAHHTLDFSGILKEGEVYFNPTGKLDDALEGEALVRSQLIDEGSFSHQL
jgi:hypothetical protein